MQEGKRVMVFANGSVPHWEDEGHGQIIRCRDWPPCTVAPADVAERFRRDNTPTEAKGDEG